MSYMKIRKPLKNIYSQVIGLWIFLLVLQYSLWGYEASISSSIYKLILLLRIFLVFITMLIFTKEKLKKNYFIRLFIFVVVVVAEYLFSNNWMLFDCFYFALFLANRISYKKVAKVSLYAFLTGFIIVVVFSSIGIFPTYNFSGDRTSSLRLSLGFHHSNGLGEIVFIIVLLIFLIYYQRYRKTTTFVMVVAAIWLYIYPNSLTVSIALISITIIRNVFEFIDVKISKNILSEKCLKILMIFSFLFFAGISYVFLLNPSLDSISVFSEFKSLFSRVYMGRMGFLRYGLTLFGTQYESIGATAIQVYSTNASLYFTIDCLYYLIPIRYGIFGAAFYLYFFSFITKDSIKNRNLDMVSIIIVMFGFSMSSGLLALAIFNFFYICQKASYNSNIVCKGNYI